ncbi:MAG TPA: cytochrome c oxidase subunit II [Bryobacteraceae bacterium]|nr:cytochrome c oxidase subunit II [Bryobacteraceae bacterium]
MPLSPACSIAAKLAYTRNNRPPTVLYQKMLPTRLLWSSLLLLAGCGGPQSALAPAGRSAERIAELFWWMAGGLIAIWLSVTILAVWAARARDNSDRRRQARLLILSGAIIPATVLCGLLIYGLALLPELSASAPQGTLKISVYGEQWWWRVRYEPASGEAFELANEVRLPVGEKVEFLLRSHNVIHSFWIPALGGKMDMIPGRVNRLVLHPTKTGIYRGVCAEYCGTAHANMAFEAIVVSGEAFRTWMAHQAAPARQPAEPQAVWRELSIAGMKGLP